MSEKYNELMGKIKVTEELRRRVMENVCNADIDSKPKIIRFPNLRRYGAIAACLALVLAGVLVVPNLFNPAESNAPVEMESGIVEPESAEALSKAVNFPISDLKTLPWRDIIEVQRANTQNMIESKEEQGGVCNAQI